jgi:hypothetical protein
MQSNREGLDMKFGAYRRITCGLHRIERADETLVCQLDYMFPR